MLNNQLPYWLAALHLPNVGPRTVMQWREKIPDLEKLFSTPTDELMALGFPQKHIDLIKQPDWKSVEEALSWATHPDHHLIAWPDEDYPAQLKEISDPPLVLYARGNKAALSSKQLAMVGSRKASSLGLKNADYFSSCLVKAGLTITSGLALGIDGASHHAALRTNGITVGVSGTGLHHIYPASHQSLVKNMLDYGGAIISELPLSILPQAANFPRRNRVIAGLSVGVLVVEAALKSGSLITARHALEQGREVFAIPGSIHSPLSRGCHHLIRQGAKLVETVSDILEELGALQAVFPDPIQRQTKDSPHTVPPEYRKLFDQIGYEITPVDVIISRSGLTAGEVSSILLTLELHGYIESVSGGYIRL